MRLIVENRFALLGLVVVALAALFGVAHVTRPAAGQEAEGQSDPVTTRVESATRVCPPPRGGDDTQIAALTPAGEGGDGRMTVIENGTAQEIGSADEAGQIWTHDASDAEKHTVVRASGSLAGGLEVTQTTMGDDAATLRCTEPTLSRWFMAPGGDRADELDLYLANIEDTPATVNFDIYAPDGPIHTPETRGIVVDPHSAREMSLNELVEGSEAVAVHVRTSRGQVAASLFAESAAGGADWVPPTEGPAKQHVIPGAPAGAGTRDLVVAIPGDNPGEVSMRVLTKDGEESGDILEGLSVPPAASTTRRLEGPLGERSGAIVVRSELPMVAGLVTTGIDGGDAAYSSAVRPLEGPLNAQAVVPDASDSKVILSAPEATTEARIRTVSADGAVGDPKKVEIKADHAVVPEIEAPDAEEYALVIEVADGAAPVYAARVVSDGEGDDQTTSIQPIPPAPAFVALPSAADSLSSVVR